MRTLLVCDKTLLVCDNGASPCFVKMFFVKKKSLGFKVYGANIDADLRKDTLL